jgi:hypothetical protein
MAYETKDGSGSLFKNDKKETEQHPDYNGSVKVGGVEYWISAWIKTGAKGTKYMSLSVRPKQGKPSPPPQKDVRTVADFSDEILF